MRYLVLSDIHSNIEALEAVMQRARRARYDRVLCCGDIVGYGPNPLEVMDALTEMQVLSIRGNHDRVASGIDEPTHFSPNARQAIEWTRARLTEAYRKRLAALPVGPLEIGRAQLVHGSFLNEDEYLYTEGDAAMDLALTHQRLTFFGHTHIASVFTVGDHRTTRWVPTYDADGAASFQITGKKFLINPGSVGQPRDGDRRASFLVWDSAAESIEFYRAEYSVKTTQEKMAAAGLPEFLAYRLGFGK
jgi:predicted phosphodiesterase